MLSLPFDGSVIASILADKLAVSLLILEPNMKVVSMVFNKLVPELTKFTILVLKVEVSLILNLLLILSDKLTVSRANLFDNIVPVSAMFTFKFILEVKLDTLSSKDLVIIAESFKNLSLK